MGKRTILIGALALLCACNPDTVVHKVGWFSTMRHQRNIKPYARPIAPVDGTVPVAGGEPPLTRTAMNLFFREVTVSDAKARSELGYRPVVTVEQGLAELAEAGAR